MERGAIKNFLCNLQKSSTGRKLLLLRWTRFLIFLSKPNVIKYLKHFSPLVNKTLVAIQCKYSGITWGVAHGRVQGVHGEADAVDGVRTRTLEVGGHAGPGARATRAAERRERQLPIWVATGTKQCQIVMRRHVQVGESGRKTISRHLTTRSVRPYCLS